MELGYSAGMRFFARIGLFFLPLLLAGCFFDKPLTPTPSEALNTWLLGEWERKEKGGGVSRAIVTPAADDIYRVQVSLAPAGGGRKEYDFEAWASRVGDSTFFTLMSLRDSAKLPREACVFLHAQLMDQNTVRLRPLQMGSPAASTSLELRKEVRARLKDGSLYAEGSAQDWKRVGEAYWGKDGQAGLFKPIRYEVPKPADATR
jgi:hypothetical protein